MTGWIQPVTLSGVDEPPYPPIPGQPPQPDPRHLQREHLRGQGYTEAQIDRLTTPLPPLPPAVAPPSRTGTAVFWVVLISVVALCVGCGVADILLISGNR